jgi:hypothetical protein
MTAEERATALQNVQKETERLCEQLEPFYGAKLCPRDFTPCKGPRCMLFLPQAEQTPDGKVVITGGSCAIAVIASQVGELGNSLMQIAASGTEPGGRTIIR